MTTHDHKRFHLRFIADTGGRTMTKTQKLIEQVCIDIQTMLIAKNKGYGNSALEPLHIFSRIDASDQLAVRIDDKLSRIAKGDLLAVQGEDYWDTVKDLIGYLILLLVQMRAGRPEGYVERTET